MAHQCRYIALLQLLLVLVRNGSTMNIPLGLVYSVHTDDVVKHAVRFAVQHHNSQRQPDPVFNFTLHEIALPQNTTDSIEISHRICSILKLGVSGLIGRHQNSHDTVLLSFVAAFALPYATLNNARPRLPTDTFISSTSMSQAMINSQNGIARESIAAQSPATPHQLADMRQHLRQNHRQEQNALAESSPTSSPDNGAQPLERSARPYVIHVSPFHADAVIDLLRHFNWPRIIYFYDSEEANARIQYIKWRCMDELKPLIRDIRIFSLDDAVDVLIELDRAYRKKPKYVVLDMSIRKAYKLIYEQLAGAHVSRKMLHFLLYQSGWEDFNLGTLSTGGVNVTGFRIVEFNEPPNPEIIPEWRRYLRFNQLEEANYTLADFALAYDAVQVYKNAFMQLHLNGRNIFHDNFRRGQFYSAGANGEVVSADTSRGIDCSKYPNGAFEDGPTIAEAMRKVSFQGATGFISFDDKQQQNLGKRRHYSLVVEEYRKGLFAKDKLGTWTQGIGFELAPREAVREEVRLNLTLHELQKVTLRVTTILDAPYMTYVDHWETKGLYGNARFEGFVKDLMDTLARQLNLTYTIKLVNDSSYGSFNEETYEWNGMIGEIIRDEADLAIAGLTINSQREEVVDFSAPFMPVGISIMIARPKKAAPGVFSFLQPLSKNVWMCIIFAYFGVSVVLFLVSRFSPYEWHVEETVAGPMVINNFSIHNTLWFSLGAFLQQGGALYPRSLSGRIAGGVWWFFALIIISSYTANLAAFLTVERMTTPIKSVEDLANQKEIEYGAVATGTTKRFFQESDHPTFKRLWDFMRNRPHVFTDTNEEGVERVRRSKGKYAFLLESSANDYFSNSPPCDTMKVGKNLDNKNYGIAAPSGSPIVEILSKEILKLQENGDLERMRNLWWKFGRSATQDGCGVPDMQESARTELKLEKLAGVFYILLAGLVLALIVAAMEFCYKANLEARRHNMQASSVMLAKARASFGCHQVMETHHYYITPEFLEMFGPSPKYSLLRRGKKPRSEV